MWPLARSVEAKQTIHDAWPAFVMNIFDPLITYSSPLRDRGGLDARHVRAGARLGEAEAAEDRGVEERTEPPLLLLVRAGDQDRACREPVGTDRRADPGAAPVQLLADEHPVEARQLEPTERLGQVQVHQADLVRLGNDVGRMSLVLVALGRPRPDLLLRELACEGSQLPLLAGERERDAADTCLDCGHDPLLCDLDAYRFGR